MKKMMSAACLGLLAATITHLTAAFPLYPAELPNGLEVPCPSHFDETETQKQCARDQCKAIGHVDCRGGDYPNAQGEFLNAFGKAFRKAGYQWTTELCNEDSDGDGKTNGEELGDPCCVWEPTALLTVGDDYRISHPGHSKDVTNSPGPSAAECKALQDSQGASEAFDKEAWVDSLYNEGEDRSNITFRVQKHAVATNETMYTRFYFPIPQDKDYYIVGFQADIVNKVHVHHFVVNFCTLPIDELYRKPSAAGVPEESIDREDSSYIPDACQQTLFIWVPGGDEFVLPKNIAIKYGKSTPYQSIFIQVHYNNPEGDTDATDSSALTAYTTSKPREHDATWWWTGSISFIGEIPPKKETFFNTAECTVQLRPECEEIHAFAYAPHAHFLGTAVWTEHYRPDNYGALTYVQELGREENYNYELQYSRVFEEEKTIRHGDVVSSSCIYNTMDRTQPAHGGVSSQEEMCVNFVLVYPAECLYQPQCITVGRTVSGDTPVDTKPPFHTPDLYPVGGSPNFTAVNNEGLISCDIENMLNNSIIGPSGDPFERRLAAFQENCPGIMGDDGLVDAPEIALTYKCSDKCVDWLINVGVCGASDFKKETDEIKALGYSSPDPFMWLPPSCYVGMTKTLTEKAGGTYNPLQVTADQLTESLGFITDETGGSFSMHLSLHACGGVPVLAVLIATVIFFLQV